MIGIERPRDALAGTTQVSIEFEGRRIQAIEGETLLSALLGDGIETFQRNPKSGTYRGPFCLMGACQDCRVLVDGKVTLSCLTSIRQGLSVQRLIGSSAGEGR
ncbi:(2Fe-2S)-binding protein [Pseudomonas putida]|uniref:(2Fe-2S)-binding protein n=1 Tax=Pseudomonas putida TaxID=303 RepID=UPI003F4192FD